MAKLIIFVVAFTALLSVTSYSQVNEVSEVTGLPIPIGAPVIYGQVVIKNLPKNEQRPNVAVVLRVGGMQVDRYRVSENGYWFFLRRPESTMTLIFEIDGNELGRAQVAGASSTRFRQDVEFNWDVLKGPAQRETTGVVSVRDRYPRSKDQEIAFEKAVTVSQSDSRPEALKLVEEILRKDPKDHNAWVLAGTLYFAEKKFDEARRAFTQAVSLKPDYFQANLNLGKLEMNQKKYEAAIAAFTKSVDIEPSSADANYLLGESYLQIKKGSLAVGFLRKAIELSPIEKADAHLRLAALYHAAGYKDLASAEYKAFLEKIKDHPDEKKLKQYITDNPPKK